MRMHAGWRGRRGATYVAGVMVLFAVTGTALTAARPAWGQEPEGAVPEADTLEWLGDSASIQKAIDAIEKRGGRVELEAGPYRLDAPIRIPSGVTLAGVWDAPHHAQLQKGTVFYVYAHAGEEDGPPLVMLEPSSAIRGVTFFYPDQRVPGTIAYPWTIQGRGMHGSVIDCTFVNAYKAIDFGTHANELHYIRNCFGSPLKAGVYVDRCTDIGRIENVHFNPHYWMRAGAPGTPTWEALRAYLFENLVAFSFGRTDWEYVHNTFTFGAKVGYHFFESPHGAANGNFLGIGADWCDRALLVEQCQMPGLLITNGEFVGGEGAEVMMEVKASNTGVVQLSNSSFWGPCESVALVRGTGTVSFSQCNFLNWLPQRTGAFTLDFFGGDVTVHACRFGIESPDIRLGPDVVTAVIMGNRFRGSKKIENRSRGDVQEGLNVVARPLPAQPSPPAPDPE